MRASSLLSGLLLCMGTVAVQADTLQVMDDASLGAVSAQQGIAFDLEYRVNTKADGEPVDLAECPTVGVLTGGSSCRVAYSLADSDGMWIVLKGYRGMSKLTNIYADAANLPGNWTSRTSGTSSGAGGNNAYKNPYTCLNRNPTTGVCTGNVYDDPRGKPVFQLTAGNWRAAGCGGTGPIPASCRQYINSPQYTDFTTSLFIERMTAEFDSSPGTRDGYLRNAVPGAPIALRIAHGVGLVPDPDNPPDVMVGPYGNAPAQIRLDGRLQIYGFGF